MTSLRATALAAAAAITMAPSAAQAEWFEVRTPHFNIYSDSDAKDALAFSERLERFDGALRTLQNIPVDQPVAETAKVTVYRFGRTSDIGALAGSYGVAGFYIPRQANPVAFTPVKEDRGEGVFAAVKGQTDLDALSVLQHEYTHHFMLRNFSAAYPKWYVEGFAEVNATIALRDDGSFIVGKPVNYRADWLLKAPQFSVNKIFNPTFKYDSGESFIQLYATGWLLIHYLTFNSERAGQLDTYLKAVNAGEDGLVAARRVFGDLGKLDRELGKYRTTKLPAMVVTPANYHPPKLTITPVDPAFSRVMSERLKTSRGVTRGDARALLKSVQSKSAPNNLEVQLLEAELGLDAKDFAAATNAADRAIALSPTSVAAIVFKARALIEAPGADAKQLSAARALLTKAHGVDKSDPRPLIEFYKAWRKQAVPVPEAAVFALEDAFPLAAHDSEYRLLLTRQLLEQDRLKQAEEVIGPLAYSYDGRDPEKYTPLVVMARIKAADRAGALAKLTEYYAKKEKAEKES